MTPEERKKRGNVMGRPRVNEEERLVSYSIRLTRAQRTKLRAIGGRAAVRKWLDSAKLPKG